MFFYTFSKGELVAKTVHLRDAVAVALACAPGSCVTDEEDMRLFLGEATANVEFSTECLDRLTRQATLSVVRHERAREILHSIYGTEYPWSLSKNDPDVIPLYPDPLRRE